jgi:predicted DsbA family dithiol-disulfide isomerase
VKIEIWADIICPWCGLGQHRFERALEEVGRGDVEVVHRSFELDPGAAEGARPVREMLAERGYPEAQLGAITGRVEALAKAEGLAPYHVGDNQVGNTRLAHELLAWASARGVDDAWPRIYRAYFGETMSIFGIDALVERAAEMGLDRGEARAVLGERRYRAAVEADLDEAQALRIRGVPFFVRDRQVAVSGAQPVEMFRELIAGG